MLLWGNRAAIVDGPDVDIRPQAMR